MPLDSFSSKGLARWRVYKIDRPIARLEDGSRFQQFFTGFLSIQLLGVWEVHRVVPVPFQKQISPAISVEYFFPNQCHEYLVWCHKWFIFWGVSLIVDTSIPDLESPRCCSQSIATFLRSHRHGPQMKAAWMRCPRQWRVVKGQSNCAKTSGLFAQVFSGKNLPQNRPTVCCLPLNKHFSYSGIRGSVMPGGTLGMFEQVFVPSNSWNKQSFNP